MLLKLVPVLLIACQAAKTNQQRDDLLKFGKSETEISGRAILNLNPDTYKKFVIDKPKNYNMFVLYTANIHMCRICKPFEDAFERVALSFEASGKTLNPDDENPIVFAIADISLHNDIGRIHNMNSLPHIGRVNGDVSDVVRLPTGALELPSRRFNIVKLDVSAQEILDWANRELGTDVALYYTESEKLTRIVVFVAAIIAVIILIIKLIMLCRRKPSVISIVALVIYYISTSGIFYNLLHGMQWAGIGPDGTTQFLFQGARGQFLGEGLTMSGLTVISGVSLFTAARLPYSESAKRIDPNTLATRLIFLLFISAACLYTVIGAYIVKVGWYSDSSMLPPPHYRQGPLRVDQGNTY